MTDREIKLEARRRMKLTGGSITAMAFFIISIPVFLIMCEITIYQILKLVGWQWLYYPGSLLSSGFARAYWIVKIIFFTVLLLPETAVLRRMFIDVVTRERILDTRRFIFSHSSTFYLRNLYSSFIFNLLKIFAFVPAVIGAVGVYYWGWVCRLDELTSPGLFGFMLCIGLTVVWIGVFFHYCISLALTPYIMALNPRSNIFDACDLSVRLMDGQHLRYLTFMLSFLKYIPTFIFIYPIFLVYPYFKVSYLVLMEDILGDYWQDKMPGMIKRWKKYLD